MIVEITKDCEHTGVKVGQLYLAERYSLDPQSKVVLLKRAYPSPTKDNLFSIGRKNIGVTEYFTNIKVIKYE